VLKFLYEPDMGVVEFLVNPDKRVEVAKTNNLNAEARTLSPLK
jgi:hypothetical protein